MAYSSAVGVAELEDVSSDAEEVRSVLAEHRRTRWQVSLFQVTLTLALFAATWTGAFWALQYSYWLTLVLTVPAAGLLMRLFVLQHDCGHGSFFASQRANQMVGASLGVLTMTPYQCWRRQHAVHHATNGQLDHRGTGDVDVCTVAEYLRLSPGRQRLYRLYRNPLVLFGVGPLIYFCLQQRLPSRLPRTWKRERASVMWTNLGVVVSMLALALLAGPWALVKVHLPIVALAASLGSWMFYLQHQFNPTYWEHDDDWDFATAATHGSSFLDLPWLLRWLTADIGLHHIHHLDSRVPNYELRNAYRAHPGLRTAARLTFWSSLRCAGLKLWDEETRRMVNFRAAHRIARENRRASQTHDAMTKLNGPRAVRSDSRTL